jgi:PHD-finger
MDEAKAIVDEGDELKLSCSELKDLRNAMRASRMWLNRVRKHNLENGEVSAEELERLLLEHNKLIIPMPEEADNLKQATKGFCLCRRPYVGFMIACDTCNEWYHGSCIGISETQADRFDTYTCIRCGVKRLFDQSVSSVVCVVKKWTSQSDLKKSRQTDFQRHQRKVRKEKKDLEKFEAILCELHSNMQIIKYPDMQLVPSISDLDKAQQTLPLPLNVDEIQANTNGTLQTISTPLCSDTALLTSPEFQDNSNLGQIDIALSLDSCQLSTLMVADSEVNQSHSIDAPLNNCESQILHDSLNNGKVHDPVHEGKI